MTGLQAGLALLWLLTAGGPEGETLLFSFDKAVKPDNLIEHNAKVEMVRQQGRYEMKVDFEQVDWPNVFFTPPQGVWDWSRYAGMKVSLYNPMSIPVEACIRVDNAGADGISNCSVGSKRLAPGEHATLMVRFNTKDSKRFWGMRGIPERGPVGNGGIIDLTRITAFQIYLPQPDSPRTLILKDIRFIGEVGNLDLVAPFPFVDPFGQYKYATWQGKLKSENELVQRAKHEAARQPKTDSKFDTYGGWNDGPTLKATGFFRTEKVDGKWWFVSPEGHLFFSAGIDCVGTWEQTFVSGRDGWFEWLPDPTDKRYAGLYADVSGTHSMADAIGGKGKTFSFYRANLMRKYGDNWAECWRKNAYVRLRAWGFNTIGNWSQEDVLDHSPVPFVASIGISGEVRNLEGGSGYWGHLKDVFDPRYEQAVDASVAPIARKYADAAACLGFFVDNELSWKSLRNGVLASPPDQFARIAFVQDLTAKYGNLSKLNEAWGTTATDWNALRVPEKVNAACDADVEAFVYRFARRYFDVIQAALKKYAPHQLYLGCRFSYNPTSVVRACADVADVLSFNFYKSSISPDSFTGNADLGKPILIGEFHFGAMDRGMFHPGLVETPNQKARAEQYALYANSVLDNPSFVGCHWFQYIDEPITGRWFDGENYNIGFVDVTDTPYPEMVKEASRTHRNMYVRRYSGKK